MKLMVALSALATTPMVLSATAAPWVVSLGWWTGVLVGLLVLAYGVRSWSDAPLQVAAFETADTRRSHLPQLLIHTAAIAGLLSAVISLVQVMAPDASAWIWGLQTTVVLVESQAARHSHQSWHLTTVLLCGAVAAVVLRTQWRMGKTTARAGTDSASDASYRRSALVILGIWVLHSLVEYPLGNPYALLPAALALVVWRGWDRPWQRAARWQAVLMVSGGAALLLCSLSVLVDQRPFSRSHHAAVGATQCPLLPPCFSSRRTPVISMPRSAALHIS